MEEELATEQQVALTGRDLTQGTGLNDEQDSIVQTQTSGLDVLVCAIEGSGVEREVEDFRATE